jgi:Na+/H+-dicarboxylate symporter
LLSVLVAITLVNVMQPGVGLEFDREALLKNQGIVSINKNVQLAQDKPWFQYIIELIPQNPVDSAARSFGGEIMALMVFSLMFGYAMSQAISEEDNPLVKCMEAIFTTTQRIILWAMQIAPYGIFAIVFNTTYRMGAGFLQNLAYFAGVVILGLLFQQFVVYSICLKVFARINPFEFFRQCREVYVYAFSTASSNATLPITLEVAEKTLKLPPEIARFVLTCGASANQNGTALFEGVAVLFLAQAFGIDLSLQQQIVVVFMSVMAGIGAAGIPGGSLPMIAIILINVGIPVEGLGLILGIDRFLDMCRTALNVSGDLVIAKLVSATAAEKCDATTSLHN